MKDFPSAGDAVVAWVNPRPASGTPRFESHARNYFPASKVDRELSKLNGWFIYTPGRRSSGFGKSIRKMAGLSTPLVGDQVAVNRLQGWKREKRLGWLIQQKTHYIMYCLCEIIIMIIDK